MRCILIGFLLIAITGQSGFLMAQEKHWQHSRSSIGLELTANESSRSRYDHSMFTTFGTKTVDYQGDVQTSALDVALTWRDPLVWGTNMSVIAGIDANRAWVVSPGRSPAMPLTNLGVIVGTGGEASMWGCPEGLGDIDCLVRNDSSMDHGDGRHVIAESFFFTGSWKEGDCWIAHGCDNPNVDGTFGPFPAIAINHDGDVLLYGRCSDEDQIHMICGGRPAGTPNWNPCTDNIMAVPTQVYLAPFDYGKMIYQPRLQVYRANHAEIADFANTDDLLKSTENFMVQSLHQHAPTNVTQANAAEMHAFDCGADSQMMTRLGTAEAGVPSVALLKILAEVEDGFRCVENSPDEICNGEKAGRPTGCVFADVRQCQNGGLAPALNGESSADGEEEEESDRAPEFPYVVALINAGNEVLCSGSIVHNRYVLTASHCKCKHGDQIRAVFVGNKIGTTADERAEYGGHVFPIVGGSMNNLKLHFEPNYCEATELEQNSLSDIAMLEFENDEPLSEQYVLSVVPNISPKSFYWSTIVGFGTSEEEAKGGTKRFARNISISGCYPDNETAHAESGCHPDVDLVSVNDESRKDACWGDSGGPAFSGGLIGIIRGGINPSAGQSPTDCGYGGLYSKISFETYSSRGENFYEWFYGVIQSQ